jgi:hypothetical protein
MAVMRNKARKELANQAIDTLAVYPLEETQKSSSAGRSGNALFFIVSITPPLHYSTALASA